jgi:Fe-S cluster biosynthesis and repair protein YggX
MPERFCYTGINVEEYPFNLGKEFWNRIPDTSGNARKLTLDLMQQGWDQAERQGKIFIDNDRLHPAQKY